MKLLRVHIKNFRLLKDLALEFSTSEEKPLTVIRAANETGKTTCEYALMWVLYGSDVLPNKGDYSLFPSDLKAKGEKRVEITVEAEIEVDQISSTGKGTQTIDRRKYRLVRSCLEQLDERGETTRQAENLSTYRIGGVGSEPVSTPDAQRIIENALPVSLKDVYFTDGDRAMSFIEAAATQGVKRKRVSDAVEALLGLDDLNSTERHLDNVARKFASEIDDTDYAKELDKLNDQIGGFEDDIKEWESDIEGFDSQLESGRRELNTCRVNIEDVLKLGDKSKLTSDIQSTERQIRRMAENIDGELQSLSKLLCGDTISRAMLKEPAKKAMSILDGLNRKNKLPKANIPILEELLDRDSCFCGADLSAQTKEGSSRRTHISTAIDDSRESDAIQEVATSLFFRSRSVNFDSAAESWDVSYNETARSFQNTLSSLSELEDRKKTLEEKVDEIEDSKLIELRDLEKSLDAKIQKLNQDCSNRTTQIQEYSSRKKTAERDRAIIETKINKNSTGGEKLDLARRTQNIFTAIIQKLKQEELLRVSEEMNRIFLEMIGADPESNDLALITKAELTQQYDIRVYGPTGHELNPDQDLNGASRRAITLAFILALTKVSEVEAPNVIDTPLGMMSGYVKQSVLMQTLKEGSQVVLFLTHDEIKGVEEILDKYAGTVFTLTNPAHYPRMLKNPPEVNDSRVVRCECNHRRVCSICERKDVEV